MSRRRWLSCYGINGRFWGGHKWPVLSGHRGVLSSAAAQKREVGLILGKLFHRIVEPFRTQVRLSSGIRVTGQLWSPFRRRRTALYGEVRLRMLCYVNFRVREQ